MGISWRWRSPYSGETKVKSEAGSLGRSLTVDCYMHDFCYFFHSMMHRFVLVKVTHVITASKRNETQMVKVKTTGSFLFCVINTACRYIYRPCDNKLCFITLFLVTNCIIILQPTHSVIILALVSSEKKLLASSHARENKVNELHAAC